ncbi:serine hydrolase domain-containing protein [Streptomyces yaizuensis]|uniref:Serine hydrolase n=1 Tax=Streptomyces yaizuensis TaxID=2989713 RepID=A0ABQ5P2Q9_9ACTN|nr:serine hydrolase domain-containing protein [Streptomyces sp. YSPA8]GLF96501.1 serine hydrolase [Streptomyces sp. YSPA8]
MSVQALGSVRAPYHLYSVPALAAAVAVGLLAGPARADPGPRPGAGVQQVMEDQVRAGVPGMLASVRDGGGEGRVWRGSAGVADVRTGERRTHQDRFRIGSVTKTFVATVVLQLEAEGRLDLDDSVESLLPGLVTGNGHDGSQVTIRQLLNHTSGISDYASNREFFDRYIGRDFLRNRFHRHTPESLVRWAMRSAPDFAPGTGWNYSNTEYILAGMIIEKVTGTSYEHQVERRILRPLGLRATSLPRHATALPEPSGRHYTKVPFGDPAGRVHEVDRLNASSGWAAGDMISTTGDLHRFIRALMSGRLLPPAQQKALTTTVASAEGGARYGLGLGRQELSCGAVVWGHAGGIHGSRSGMYLDERNGRSFVVNANAEWATGSREAAEAAFCPAGGPTGGGPGSPTGSPSEGPSAGPPG